MSKEATPPWGLLAVLAMGVSMLSLILAVIALSRSGPSPAPAPPPPPALAPTPTPAPDPAPVPVAAVVPPVSDPVPTRPTPTPPVKAAAPVTPTAKLAAYRRAVDELGRGVMLVASAYPPSLPAHASGSVPVKWDWPTFKNPDAFTAEAITFQTVPDVAPPIPGVDEAARSFLDHVVAWLPRWSAQHRYFDRGDYLDDDLAAGRAADAEIRESLATAVERWRTLHAALEAPWQAEVAALAARAPDSDRATLDRAWEACRKAAELVVDHATPDLAAIAVAGAACRDATDTLRARRLRGIWAPYFLDTVDNLAAAVAKFRREGTHRDALVFHLMYSALGAMSLRAETTDTQAEAAVP